LRLCSPCCSRRGRPRQLRCWRRLLVVATGVEHTFDAGSHVPLKTARKLRGHLRPVRVGCCISVAALSILFSSNSLQTATADGDTRSISLRHTHTNEKLTITY